MKGHIQKRGDKSWRIHVYLGIDANGKKKYTSKTITGTKKQAQQMLTEMLHELNNGTFSEPSGLTVGQFFDRWLTDYAQANIGPRTFEGYQKIISLHIKPRIGHHLLNKLTPLHLQRYYSVLLKEGKFNRNGTPSGSGLSPTTVLQHHRIIKEALSHALRWGLVARNVAESVEPPRKVRSQMKTWSPEEAVRFLEYIKNERYYAFYLMAVMTGMRLGELLGLRWIDVDLQAGTLSIQQTLLKAGPNPLFGNAKSDRSRRKVALPPVVITALTKYKAIQNQERLALGSDYVDTGLVFTRSTGHHMNTTTMSKTLFHKLLRASGVPQIRFHDIRHTHATLLLKEGVNPKIVSERLGHSGVNITLDIYSHVLPEMQQEAAKAAERSIFGS